MDKRRLLPILFKLGLLLAVAVSQVAMQDNCEIDEALLDAINQKLGSLTSRPGGGSRSVYVCNLSFIDGVTKTGFLSDEGKLIDAAVKDGMHLASQSNPNIKINDPDHTLPNTAANVDRLIQIYFDPGLTVQQKYDKAAADLLTPAKVDILVTGVIVDSGSSIQVRPMGVSKPDRTVKTKDLSYQNKDELFVEVNGTLALSKKAHEEIQKAVKEIIEN